MNLHFGVDYYPEHWPKSRWELDAELMQKMGIQVVRMAEFSWHKMEPTENEYHFEWLDEVIDLLAKHKIKTILGTPTAAPPAWLIHKVPEILPVDRDGLRRGFGGRHHDCQSNSTYREFIKKFVSAYAEHFGTNENVCGWQVDNELGNSHEELCTCDSCRARFQNWLQDKYRTIDALNEAWGNAFWSQEYNTFEEVQTPRKTVTGENPSAMLDWKCFCSDLIVDFQQFQIDIIHKYSKNQFITHNCMGFANKVNYYDLAKNLDFASHDQYPGGFYLYPPMETNFKLAASCDVIRSLKKKTFWIMEQQSGITGWTTMGRSPEPGQLSMWALQSIAHGADAVVFFRWRTCAMGTEQYWHGVLPHSGKPGRTYDELKHLISYMNPYMDQLQGLMPKSQVAIVYSYRQNYAFQIQPHHKELEYVNHLLVYYKALYDLHIPVDFVSEEDDISQYSLVIAPLQYLMTKELEDKYFEYVKQGGHIVLTMRTGVKDEHNICMTERELPGRLADLVGITVEEYDCLLATHATVEFQKKEYQAFIWSDIIQLHGATQIATYTNQFYAGTTCISENSYGNGIAYYIGTQPSEELMSAFMQKIVATADIKTLGMAAKDVEFMTRESQSEQWLFVINHTNLRQQYQLHEDYQLFEGNEKFILDPYEVHLLKK